MDSLKNRIWITGKELMDRWQVLEMDFREHLMKEYMCKKPLPVKADGKQWKEAYGYLTAYSPDLSRTIIYHEYSERQLGFKPHESVDPVTYSLVKDGTRDTQIDEAAAEYGLDKLMFRVWDVLEFEKQHNMIDDDSDALDKPLDGKERRELGRLHREKEKWEVSIKAAVHATLFCQGKKVKRDELKDELYKFDLPDTTFERIWKALREKNLTNKGGRPRKPTE